MPRTSGCAAKPSGSWPSPATAARHTSTFPTWRRAGTSTCFRAGSRCSRGSSSTSSLSEDFYADPDRHVNDSLAIPRPPATQAREPDEAQPPARPGHPPRNPRAPPGRFRRPQPWPGGTARAPAALARRAGSSFVDPPGRSANEPPEVPRLRRRRRPWPSVTVIVPTRDRPAMLARAVRSMVGQSYPGDDRMRDRVRPEQPVPVNVELPAGRRVRLSDQHPTPGRRRAHAMPA